MGVVSKQGTLLYFSLSLSIFWYSRRAFTRIFRSYGWGWSWKLSPVRPVHSVPWKFAQVKCHRSSPCINRVGVTPLTHELSCSLQNHTSSSISTISSSSALLPQSKMFEAWMGMRGLRTLQRYRILKVTWFRQGWHRFKPVPRFDRGKMVLLPLSVKIWSRFWSCQIFGMSEEGISAISAVCLVAGKFSRGLLNFRLPTPFLQWCRPQVGFLAPFFQQR